MEACPLIGPTLRQLALITGRVTIEPHGTDGAIKIIVEHGDGKHTTAIRAIRFTDDQTTERVIDAALTEALKHVTTVEPPNKAKIEAERAARAATKEIGIPDRGDLPFVM
jgi:hypothetical protein